MSRIAITGATGYVGRRVVRVLRSDPSHEIRVLSRRAGAVDGAAVIVGDIEDATVRRSLVDGVDYVIHAAGLVRSTDARALERINVDASRGLAEAARDAGVRRFVHVSSTGVYGLPGGPVDEDSRPRPRSPYERSKLASEETVRDALGDAAAIIRPSNVIGPGHPLRPLRRLLSRVKRHGLILHGAGWTNYVAVDDVAKVIAAAATSVTAPAIVVINAPLAVGDFLRRAGAAVGVGPRAVQLPLPIDGAANAVLRVLGARLEVAERARALLDRTRYVSRHDAWLQAQGVDPTVDGVLAELAREYALVRP